MIWDFLMKILLHQYFYRDCQLKSILLRFTETFQDLLKNLNWIIQLYGQNLIWWLPVNPFYFNLTSWDQTYKVKCFEIQENPLVRCAHSNMLLYLSTFLHFIGLYSTSLVLIKWINWQSLDQILSIEPYYPIEICWNFSRFIEKSWHYPDFLRDNRLKNHYKLKNLDSNNLTDRWDKDFEFVKIFSTVKTYFLTVSRLRVSI